MPNGYNNQKILGVVTQDENALVPQQQPIMVPQQPFRPMLMRFQPQPNMRFPLMFLLFPRIALFMMSLSGQNMFSQGNLGVRHITQLVRDKDGYIKEIVEFVR